MPALIIGFSSFIEFNFGQFLFSCPISWQLKHQPSTLRVSSFGLGVCFLLFFNSPCLGFGPLSLWGLTAFTLIFSNLLGIAFSSLLPDFSFWFPPVFSFLLFLLFLNWFQPCLGVCFAPSVREFLLNCL